MLGRHRFAHLLCLARARLPLLDLLGDSLLFFRVELTILLIADIYTILYRPKVTAAP